MNTGINHKLKVNFRNLLIEFLKCIDQKLNSGDVLLTTFKSLKMLGVFMKKILNYFHKSRK